MTKEPWQMTREEWYARPQKAQLEEAFDAEMMALPQTGNELKIALASLEDKYQRLGLGQEHGEIVEGAIAEGKPVPAKVLKDYPDLARVDVGMMDVGTRSAGQGATTAKDVRRSGRGSRGKGTALGRA